MAVLGGSPLGIIGVKSVPENGGMSGFNGGASRNVNVSNYNRSKALSLFTGRRRLRAWPNISASKSTYNQKNDKGDYESLESQDTTGLSDVYIDKEGKLVDNFKSSIGTDSSGNPIKGSNLLHNNDVYDTSVLNILEKLAETKAALRPTDFAYLKNIGVYPNNRLMIARRFVSPSGDNIMVKKDSKEVPSIATLISWRGEGDDFIEITFGEEWGPAKADFTNLLTSLGDDFGKSNLGGIAGAAGNILPLPGFTEIFQRKFLESVGLLEEGSSSQIPSGNPNLIKEAKQRKTVGYGEAASGLTATISIKMTCEYELKFISGIDPTIVWMDIIGMILRFGTSESSNYGLSQAVAAKMGRWAANPYKMIEDVINGIKDSIKNAQKELTDAIMKVYDAATLAAANIKEVVSTDTKEPKTSADLTKEANAAAEMAKNAGLEIINKLAGITIDTIKASVLKYRVEVMGIVNALSGNPSTPWHITIGNPLRPVFCSGDMLTQSVSLKLGPILAFNDLPSSITADFTLANARPLGMQEIMAKFNSGYLRTVDTQKTFFETMMVSTPEGLKTEPVGVLPGEFNLVKSNADIAISGTIIGGTVSINQGGGNTPAPALKTTQQTKLVGGAKKSEKEETSTLENVATGVGNAIATGANAVVSFFTPD